MLGVGLHSYGFMESAFWALSGFIASQLALIALCFAPARFWRRTAEAASAKVDNASFAPAKSRS
jgi:hypothetical protein